MGNEHLTDQTTCDERDARGEWESLLMRLQTPRSDNARVEQVRHAIERGEFRVDSRAIAERLIARTLTS